MTAITVGLGGLAGWRVLQRMESRQVEATAKDPVVQRAAAYFKGNLSTTTTADDLVGDYKMLQVALGAFGLDTDIANKAFIRKVLESDLGDRSSLANRLGDKRYLRFAEAFGNIGDAAATDQSGGGTGMLDALRSLSGKQRSAVLASYLGWTLDAFDYFILVFVLKDVAKTFGSDVPTLFVIS